MPVNTKYPNLPDDFIDRVREERNKRGLTLRAFEALSGINSVQMSQYETRKRNVNYETAVLIRDTLGFKYRLPKPDLTMAPMITRHRGKFELLREPMFIEVDGRLLKVMTYYDMGPIIRGKRR